MSKIHLKIVTPERLLLEEEVDELIVPTKAGQISILPNHSNLISELAHGDVIIKYGNKEDIDLVFGGFIEVSKDSNVLILADGAEHIHELTEEEILEAKKRAEETLANARDDHERFAEAQAILAKTLTRLSVVRKHKSRKNINLN